MAEVGAVEARGLAVARVQDRRVAEDVEVDLLEREVVDLVGPGGLLEPLVARPAAPGAADELELAADQPVEPLGVVPLHRLHQLVLEAGQLVDEDVRRQIRHLSAPPALGAPTARRRGSDDLRSRT